MCYFKQKCDQILIKFRVLLHFHKQSLQWNIKKHKKSVAIANDYDKTQGKQHVDVRKIYITKVAPW